MVFVLRWIMLFFSAIEGGGLYMSLATNLRRTKYHYSKYFSDWTEVFVSKGNKQILFSNFAVERFEDYEDEKLLNLLITGIEIKERMKEDEQRRRIEDIEKEKQRKIIKEIEYIEKEKNSEKRSLEKKKMRANKQKKTVGSLSWSKLPDKIKQKLLAKN